MGIRRFLLYLRQKTQPTVPLLESLTYDDLQFATVTVDANNYFYKFLATESDSSLQIEEYFCILTSSACNSMSLVMINDHLGRCETSSERHLLRCLYIFCHFCHTSLRLRHLVFVIDGAAPNIKTAELAERKQQKRLAYGKVLLERRTLLLHRIYVLRWYQVSSIAFALLENYQSLTQSSNIGSYREAMIKLLQNSFEWALGTEIPSEIFELQASQLETHDNYAAFCDLFAKLRMTVQTSFLVEFDFGNSHFYYLDICKVFEAFVEAMIKSSSKMDSQKPKPFILCLHINAEQADQIQRLFANYAQKINECWQNCCSTFLLCTVVHSQRHKSFIGIPPQHASDFFQQWEQRACKYWCNPEIFCHRHQFVWREIKYAEWLCSVKGDEWLRNAYQSGSNRDAYYYQVPKRYSQCYDTENDTSHQNLDWTIAAMQLFSNSLLNSIQTTDQLHRYYFPRLAMDDIKDEDQQLVEEPIPSSSSDQMLEDTSLTQSIDVVLEQKQKEHQRFRIRDAFMQIIVHFLRVVCGTPVLVAEHEAEATCAKLCRDKICDFVFSDDIDALAFGSPNIVIDWPDIAEIGKSLMLMSGTLRPKFSAKIIRVNTLQRHFNLSLYDFTLWCIFCGTDFMHVGESKLSVAMTLRTLRNFSTLSERVQQLEQKKYIPQNSLDLVNRVYEFFYDNQAMPQTEFLTKQFAPMCVDETQRIDKICASRKLGRESE